MKTIILAVLMTLLFSSIAHATSVNTDYEGSGEFYMQTTILSSVSPIVTDTVSINSGCNVGCCCPGECCPEPGTYFGNQFLTNNPFSYAGHTVSITNGCVDIEQKYTDVIGGQTIDTVYYTYFNGTGYAESYVYAIPGEAMSYQFANGTGYSFVSFNQTVFKNGNFDYGTTYGGGSYICSSGYAGLMNYYYLSSGQIFYSAQLGLYCVPVGGNLYSFLFAKGTDKFGLSSSSYGNFWETSQEIDVDGASAYGFTTESNDNFNFDFDMGLG